MPAVGDVDEYDDEPRRASRICAPAPALTSAVGDGDEHDDYDHGELPRVSRIRHMGTRRARTAAVHDDANMTSVMRHCTALAASRHTAQHGSP